MKRLVAVALSLSISLTGCAMSTRATNIHTMDRAAEQRAISDYAGQMHLGTRVRATLDDNRVVKGTLVKRRRRRSSSNRTGASPSRSLNFA